jgi:hypothetical protein
MQLRSNINEDIEEIDYCGTIIKAIKRLYVSSQRNLLKTNIHIIKESCGK